MVGPDVPSPVDFHDPAQAAAWETETTRRRLHRPAFFAAIAEAINEIGPRPVSVIELGSGPGHLIERLQKDCNIGRYVAVDFSTAMHDLARRRAQGAGVEFVTLDFRSDDWVAGLSQADVVVTLQSAHELRHTRHLRPWLVQLRSLLRPGGLLLYCDHYFEADTTKHRDLFLDREDQLRAVGDAGFLQPIEVLDLGGMMLVAARA